MTNVPQTIFEGLRGRQNSRRHLLSSTLGLLTPSYDNTRFFFTVVEPNLKPLSYLEIRKYQGNSLIKIILNLVTLKYNQYDFLRCRHTKLNPRSSTSRRGLLILSVFYLYV